MTDAVVVGSGPNGLAAAVTLAQAGLEVLVLEAADNIGGGARTAELTLPGLKHDLCSAIHPFAAASPFLNALPLDEHGLTWRRAEIDAVHPLLDGTAGVLHRSLQDTAAGLGADAARWRTVFGPLVEHFDVLAADALGPLLRIPRHPIIMSQLGMRALPPASVLARVFSTEQARALIAGCATHIYRPLHSPASSSIATMMIAAGHSHGWPVAQGGSAAIAHALASLLSGLGGTIVTGVRVASPADLPPAALTMFDTSPTALVAILGARVPPRRARAMARYAYGPAAYKLDLAVQQGIPWTVGEARRAATVHVGGTLAEVALAENQMSRGVMPQRPFVLVGQQYLADPGRSVGDVIGLGVCTRSARLLRRCHRCRPELDRTIRPRFP